MLYDDLVMPGEYICHHGIKGQKWGIRRFQNKDGSLTSEGKARYSSNTSVNKDQKTIPIAQKIQSIKDADLLTENAYWNGGRKFRGRLKKAADTGLIALNNTGRDGYDPKIGITDDDRFWFTCEDQTIGLVTVADLVNRGKTKSEILSLINYSTDIINHSRTNNTNDDNVDGVFQLNELSYSRWGDKYGKEHQKWLNDFIDECDKNKS